MSELKIYVADDSEYSESTSIDGGTRSDVIVQINGELFRPIFYDIISLTQEYNESVATGQPYNIDNNIIIVPEVSRQEIIKAVLYLFDKGYFNKAKPIDLLDEFKDSFVLFPNLRDLSGWVQIY